MTAVLLLLTAYLFGAIPTGYWVVKALKGVDIRTVGSGSTGATNVLRAAGKSACVFTLVVDIAKGAVPVAAAIDALNHGLITGIPAPVAQWWPFLAAIIAIIGHARSIFLNFAGGKSAATALGCVVAMNPLAAACSFTLFLSLVTLTRYVSIGSMIAAFSSAIFTWVFGGHISYVAFCTLGSIYICIRHKANIERLLAGTEPRIGQSKPAKPETEPARQNELEPSSSGDSQSSPTE